MKEKIIKLVAKKGGNGYISSYTINLGISELRENGFIDKNNNPLQVKKIIENGKITLIPMSE